jgi:hypothetical protein
MSATNASSRAARTATTVWAALRTQTAVALIATAGGALTAVYIFTAYKHGTVGELKFRHAETLAPFLGVAALVAALPARWVPVGLFVTLATWLATAFAIEQVPDELHTRASVASAVGGSTFFGTPYIPGQIAMGLIAAGLIALTLIAAVVIARREPAAADAAAAEADDDTDGDGDVETGPTTWRDRLLRPSTAVILATALFAFTIVPLLGTSLYDHYRGGAPGWDFQNLIASEHAIQRGLTPMRDFFWPYGWTSFFYRFPEGIVFSWLSQVLQLGATAWVVWRLSPPEGRATRAIVAVLLIGVLGFWASFVYRYGLSLVLVGVYVAVGPLRSPRPSREHLILAAFAAYVALYEFDLFLFGAAGCALIALVELARRSSARPWLPVLRAALVDGGALLVAVPVLLLSWIASGSLDGNARWWLGLRNASAYGAPRETTDGALVINIGYEPTYEMMLVGLPLLILAAGLMLSLMRGRSDRAAGQIVTGAGVIGVLLLFKHLGRPQDGLALLVPFIAVIIASVLLWSPRRWLSIALAGAFAGMLLYAIGQQKALRGYYDTAKNAPDRVLESVKFAGDGSRRVQASAARFKIETYPGWTGEPEMAVKLRQAQEGSPDKHFAVLGDAAGLYFLLDQRPPFHFELYDASPRGEQEAMIDALDKEDVPFILWRRDLFIDGVPQAVRTPLVVNWVIDHFMPRPIAGPDTPGTATDVLIPRQGPVPLGWWASRMGDTVDLGHVPSASTADDDATCTGGGDCVRYAMVKSNGEPKQDRRVIVRVAGPAGVFHVALLADKDTREYPIRLDRLWFYRYLGGPVTVSTRTPGFQVRDVRVKAGDDLY